MCVYVCVCVGVYVCACGCVSVSLIGWFNSFSCTYYYFLCVHSLLIRLKYVLVTCYVPLISMYEFNHVFSLSLSSFPFRNVHKSTFIFIICSAFHLPKCVCVCVCVWCGVVWWWWCVCMCVCVFACVCVYNMCVSNVCAVCVRSCACTRVCVCDVRVVYCSLV